MTVAGRTRSLRLQLFFLLRLWTLSKIINFEIQFIDLQSEGAGLVQGFLPFFCIMDFFGSLVKPVDLLEYCY